MQFEVHQCAVVTSTMDVAAEAATRGAAEGWTVVAEEQTAGRGRRGRRWASPPGAGLYCSIVLRPRVAPGGPLLPLLTLAAGVGLREGVRAATGLAAELKWPNDLVVGRRKLAGILAEGMGLGAPDQAVVLGIGINVRSTAYPPDVAPRATSLEAELGRAVDRQVVLAEVLRAVGAAYEDLAAGRADAVRRRWEEASPTARGAAVTWETPEGPRRGRTAGLDTSGALLVDTPTGRERLVGGEVRWDL